MRKALVVDDELDIGLMLTNHLRKCKFEPIYASNVKEAKLKIAAHTFELIFLDLNLTDGSGYDVINYSNELILNPKIIVISAYDNEESKAIMMGATLFIKKPFTLKLIDDALETLYFMQTSNR